MSTTAPPARPGPSRWLRRLLILSLAANLLVAGVLAGAALRPTPPESRAVPASRSLGFGPWAGGLTRDDYRALRRELAASGMDFRAIAAADRADHEALIAALRAEPFDPATLDAVAARQRERAIARMDLGERLIRDHVAARSPAERRAMATRMEQARHDRDRHHGRKPADR